MCKLKCGDRFLDLSQTQVMGILNVTPDSFSDGGKLYTGSKLLLDEILVRAEAMVREGASILDVGGESTRPGAKPVGLQEELDRVLPVVEKIASELDVIISVDSSAPKLMRESAKLGAGMINDVRALGREGAIDAVRETDLAVCLMHMQGNPANMQERPEYSDVLDEVCDFLSHRVDDCLQNGILKERIVLDPGFGFGKTVEHNLRLLNRIDYFRSLELPLLVGTSRKSMIGAVLGREIDQRLAGSLATIAIAAMKRAEIVRVHDVAETMDVVKMVQAVNAEALV
ncbi:dihydropteroate synthase [uncultured Neptuniibacter sp.]|uniref:dihydropteroate synthase n=1 Tax=uncultured Neptuniibacter sp. TaxID=502143 RepID=UPI00261E27DB|nr:dihydropteroate synthase [uncultured Neptuniibacter sp.]